MLFDLLDWLRRYPALSGPATHLSNVRFRGRRDLHGHHRQAGNSEQPVSQPAQENKRAKHRVAIMPPTKRAVHH
jgi:hypothetical protein